ncbi:hypothetical protein [Sessilibacter corallicola]|uniref:hypothetical protein n=1 Tax=Sessilibacter corallicola TaxID=2904075 RepID=UPI001E540AB6|nr:hypothetical protein [Sessilibacter corallicola]MCE2029270.1 hypothetical protein [Sessilibacter corallicola]
MMKESKSNEWSLPEGINFDDTLMMQGIRDLAWPVPSKMMFGDTLMERELAMDRSFFNYHAYGIRYQLFDSEVDASRSWSPANKTKAEIPTLFLKPLVKKIRESSDVDESCPYYFSQAKAGCLIFEAQYREVIRSIESLNFELYPYAQGW